MTNCLTLAVTGPSARNCFLLASFKRTWRAAALRRDLLSVRPSLDSIRAACHAARTVIAPHAGAVSFKCIELVQSIGAFSNCV
jgi:hypothetical protein